MGMNPQLSDITGLWAEVLANAREGKVQIFVADGINSRKKRKEIYPEYKGNRKAPIDISIYDGLNFFKELLKEAPPNVLFVELPETEADDIIACLCKNLPKPLHVLSNDSDLIQLTQIEGVTCLATSDVEPRWIRLYKTLVGDPSDNIPGVKGFGKKAWEGLSDRTKVEFERVLDSENDNLDVSSLKTSLKPSHYLMVIDMLHSGELKKYWDLVGFINVDYKTLPLKAGTGDIAKVDKMFKEMFHGY
jgi:5'-3' exonuclease